MKWVLIIIGGLFGLVALVAIIGAILPRGHVASRTARFSKTPAEIWTAISDFASTASWRADVNSMEQMPDLNGNPVWKEENKQGPITYEVTTSEPPKRMVMRIADDTLPFGGTWTYEIEQAGDGSTLTITENGEIYNPIFRFMARFVFGYRATIETYLKDLGVKFGEEVTFST